MQAATAGDFAGSPPVAVRLSSHFLRAIGPTAYRRYAFRPTRLRYPHRSRVARRFSKSRCCHDIDAVDVA